MQFLNSRVAFCCRKHFSQKYSTFVNTLQEFSTNFQDLKNVSKCQLAKLRSLAIVSAISHHASSKFDIWHHSTVYRHSSCMPRKQWETIIDYGDHTVFFNTKGIFSKKIIVHMHRFLVILYSSHKLLIIQLLKLHH